ncbi:hypothetical protein KTC96_24950 (plasmid) [Clostridium estertheticum]|nr:hypothetical protein [Clostridium estertheticum]MBX4259778.1 hypothetical protein [Clostridium estertheticum]WLC73270.1 hypothetical protein KTC96_24950 [Clostridium estertheticum]
MNDCQFCEHSYIAGDDQCCLGFMEPKTCGDNFEIANQLKDEKVVIVNE